MKIGKRSLRISSTLSGSYQCHLWQHLHQYHNVLISILPTTHHQSCMQLQTWNRKGHNTIPNKQGHCQLGQLELKYQCSSKSTRHQCCSQSYLHTNHEWRDATVPWTAEVHVCCVQEVVVHWQRKGFSENISAHLWCSVHLPGVVIICHAFYKSSSSSINSAISHHYHYTWWWKLKGTTHAFMLLWQNWVRKYHDITLLLE